MESYVSNFNEALYVISASVHKFKISEPANAKF